MSRVSKRSLPNTPRRCTLAYACVYRKDGICDEPQINKGNGDAGCHRANNKDVLAALVRLDSSVSLPPMSGLSGEGEE